MKRVVGLVLVAGAGLLVVPSAADAYIGPGAGITAIGTVVAFIGAIVFAIVGFVWYPVKRLLRAARQKSAGRPEEQKASPS